MKFSIIMVVKNRVLTIEKALRSIFIQDYKDYEIIVIDGKSNDGTLEIIQKHNKKIKTIISEKDYGIYDAMNKGLFNANGDIICFLNSDDYYADKATLSEVADIFKNKYCDIVYGDIIYVSQQNPPKIIRYWKNKLVSKNSFFWGHHPPHPAFFAKKKLYDRVGKFNSRLEIIADFELMMRLFKNCSNYQYLRKICVVMRLGGASNKNIRSIFRQNVELIKSFRNETKNFNLFLFLFSKLFLRISQLILALIYRKKIKII